MKILWLFSGGMFKNGICMSQLDYYKKIDKKKYTIDVLTIDTSSREMIDQFKNEGCIVYILANKRKHLFKYIKQLEKIIKREKYDVVHVHGSSYLLSIDLNVAKKCGVKVRIAHSRNTSCDHLLINRLFRKSFDKSYNVALACGNEAGKWLFNDGEFIVFHNGKDLKKFEYNQIKRDEYREKLNIKEKVAIGHVGVFSKQKNHMFLVDVFNDIHKINDNTYLFLFGVGNLQKSIKDKVHSLGLDNNVFFMNNKNNIEFYLNAMDVMLFPSFFEGLPNVVLEWQASGLPCLISDKITKECAVCDLVTYLPIDKGTKLWVKAFNSIDIDEKKRYQKSKDACEKLRENNFDIEENTKKLEMMYSSYKQEKGD